MNDRTCVSCRAVITDDPDGYCEDCKEGIVSEKAGSVTLEQRDALIGLLMDQGFIGEGKWRARAIMIAEVIPGWAWKGDLGGLSQKQAGDLLERLEQRRLSQEARGL
jgi:hypothetical protein